MSFLEKINPLKKKKQNSAPDPENHDDAVFSEQYAYGETEEQVNGIEHDDAANETEQTEDREADQRDLSEIVQNERVEPGIPQDLSAGTNKNMRKVAFLGVAIVAAGAAVAPICRHTGTPR